MSSKPGMLLETILQDLRFGARGLIRHRGFAAVAVLTLALGIGANAAIFSVVNAVLLEPLPWGQPDRAVMIWSRWTAFDKTWVASGEVVDYRKRARTLAEVGAWSDGQMALTEGGDPERLAAAAVTANLFDTLGVQPMLGRVFAPREDLPNGPRLVMLGYGLWTRRFGSDPGILGRSVVLDGETYEVVGVMPPGFLLPTDYQNPQPSQLWVPLQMDPADTNHGSHGLYAAARLAAGAMVEQAGDELHRIARDMTREGLYPPAMQFDTVTVSLRDEVVGGVRRSIWLLFGAVGFLLLIASANVANLLLARAEGRQREMAVRTAIGAGAMRVVRQLLTESLVLTAVSAAAGLALAFAGVRFLAWWNPAGIPRVSAVALDTRVLGFTAVVALLTTVLFSLAPALRALHLDLTDALKDGGQGASAGASRQRFRNGLVVVQMALAVVLLVGAGLTLRSLWALQRTPLGLEPANVLTMRLALPPASYATPERVVQFYDDLVGRVRALPGVRLAGAARALPLGSTIGDFGLTVEGYTPPPGAGAKGDWQIATDGYLEAIGERIVSGRSIQASDTSRSQLVVLINEELARRYFAGRDPLGGRLRVGRDSSRPWLTVVGVVGDVRHNGLTEPVKEKFYVPHTQWHLSTGNSIRSMTLVIKAANAPALTSTVRDTIRGLDPSLPVSDVRTMDDVVAATLSTPRFTGMLLSLFAGLALVLSGIGVYGVLAYLVSRRTREIGIRMAIGADRGDVLRLVLKSGFTMALLGVAAGLAIAAGVVRLMQGMLHGVSPIDPLTFATVALALPAMALLASVVPAWRAARVNPVTALKTD